MSGFLLDTQVALWMLLEPRRLSCEARRIINEEPHVFVSAASLWEIETKRQIGKLNVQGDVRGPFQRYGLRELPVRWVHAAQLALLPLIHRDPFDRILAAQALAENMTLVTADGQLAMYPIRTVF